MNRIKFIFFLGFCFVQLAVIAQPNRLDSLLGLIKKGPALSNSVSDTSRMNTLSAIGDCYQKINADSALFYHLSAITVANSLLSDEEKISKLAGVIIELKKGDNIKKSGWDNLLLGDSEKAMIQFSKAIVIAEKYSSSPNINIQRKGQELFAAAIFNIGTVYYVQSEYPLALENYFKALKINREIGNKKGESANLGNIGAVYHSLGNYSKALEFYFQALRMDEELKNKSGQSYNLGNIGITYRGLGEISKALEYYLKAQVIDEELGDKSAQSANLTNIGAAYEALGKPEKALPYFMQALQIDEELSDQRGIAIDNGNIGAAYFHLGESDKALEYYFLALRISEDLDDKETQIFNLGNIGEVYIRAGNYKEAENYLMKGLSMAKEIDAVDLIKTHHFNLSRLYEKSNRPALALIQFKEYILYRDSIFNSENTKAGIQKEMQFGFDKKAAADSVAFAKETEINEAEIAKNKAEIKAKKNQQYALFGGLFLVLIFAGFMYNRFKVTNRQKQIIEVQKQEVEKQKEYAEEQHHLVEEKNKEITDSINYAKRIQAAILPPNRIVKEFLPESFILYKPKDIVAGDFYWLESYAKASNSEGSYATASDSEGENKTLAERSRSQVLFAAADCTGHGVPGAMVSVICNNGLNRSVREHGLSDPGKILDKTREIVIQEFEKSDDEVKDGMDISLCALTPFSLGEGPGMRPGVRLEWAGANNPLWIIKKDSSELIEIKADKQPIGKYAEPKPFTTHKIDLQKGDSVYIFTDGFQDQFGGEKGKKFKASTMKDLLLSIQEKSMDEQKQILEKTFEKWRGQLEQIDDVCIIGVRI